MLCLDAVGEAPKVWSTYCCDRMLTNHGYTENRALDMSGAPSAPLSKVTRRFESSWSGAVRTLAVIGSHISNPEISTCLAESVGEDVCYVGTTSWFSINR